MTSAPIAVIGGCGFIGSVLVERLLAQGRNVRIVDIAPSSRFGDLIVHADLRDASAIRQALCGCTAIVDLAAVWRDDVRPASRYYEVNVAGARNVAAAATANGIERVVFTSSVSVYPFIEGEIDETVPPGPLNDYGRSKLEAEGIWSAWHAGAPGRSLVIVRPTVVFGPGNTGNVYNLVRQIIERRFVMIGDGSNRKSISCVENVADFLAFCVDLPADRLVVNYADKPDLTMAELVADVNRLAGLSHASPLRVPYPLAAAVAMGLDHLGGWTGRSFRITAERVRKFCANTQYSSARARALAFAPTVPVREALRKLVHAEAHRS